MRDVERQIEEEGPVFALFEKGAGFSHHQVGEVAAILPVLGGVAPEVVFVWPRPIEEVGVVVDAADLVSEEGIEALIERPPAVDVSEVPLADEGGTIAGLLEHFGDGDLLGGHAFGL